MVTKSWADTLAKPVTWPDGRPTYLPGAWLTATVPAGTYAYLEITTSQSSALDGIQCDAYDPAKNIGNAEFVGSSIALNQTQIMGSMPNGVGQQGTVRTPVLGPGSYTVGIVSYCQPPDAVNDPQATYFLSASTFQVTRIPVTAP